MHRSQVSGFFLYGPCKGALAPKKKRRKKKKSGYAVMLKLRPLRFAAGFLSAELRLDDSVQVTGWIPQNYTNCMRTRMRA